jgi:hypothetical protein
MTTACTDVWLFAWVAVTVVVRRSILLADVTVKDTKTGKASVLHTTWHHPFWNAGTRRWTDAAGLKTGDKLRSPDGETTRTVAAVKVWTGLKWMQHLTVNDTHTYYVIAGNTPILVHNCGGAYDWKPGNRPGLDTQPQGPLPADSGIGHGQSLAEGEHHYVVMRDGSLRAMHNDDMFGIEPSAGHTSLAGNQPVHMAGTFDVNESGQISRFDNWSGHYGPQNMPGFTPLENIARSAIQGHGLPAPGVGAWEYHAF